MTTRPPNAVSELATRLRQAGCVFAEEEAELLLDAATDADELAAMVARRSTGVPLEQVVGWAEFCGLRILLDPGVFVPRRRTEALVREAIALAPRRPVVVDLCCGSGAVGAALSAQLVAADLYAVDLDPAAVRCARRNLAPDKVLQGDLFEPLPTALRGRLDLLVVNAPYVPAGELHLMPAEARVHEPRIALDGGADGLDVHRRVAAQAARWLAPGGHLLTETSPRQSEAAAELFTEAGLHARVRPCAEMEVTVVVGTAPGPVARRHDET
jgi:release factor glutamine methyltransferase